MRNTLALLPDAVPDHRQFGDPQPRTWGDPAHLAEWEQWHVTADSGVWAVREQEGQLKLYAPGSAAPGGGDPWKGVKPADVRTAPNMPMPYPDGVADVILHWVARHAGAPVLLAVAGPRHVATGNPDDPVMFVQIDLPDPELDLALD